MVIRASLFKDERRCSSHFREKDILQKFGKFRVRGVIAEKFLGVRGVLEPVAYGVMTSPPVFMRFLD